MHEANAATVQRAEDHDRAIRDALRSLSQRGVPGPLDNRRLVMLHRAGSISKRELDALFDRDEEQLLS
jgi:hypothetical protein